MLICYNKFINKPLRNYLIILTLMVTQSKTKQITIPVPSADELAEAGAQIGHFKNKFLPKMKPFICALRNNIHFIDLDQTVVKLQEAVNFIIGQVSSGSNILFLGTKPVAKDIIEKYAKKAEVPYINQRWLGGTLTNFPTIFKLIDKFNKMSQESESDAWQKYTKKERLDLSRELEKLETMVGGISSLKKRPDLVYIVDIVNEKTALLEAIKCQVPVIAIIDTNANPESVDWPIPANDDAIKTVEMITGLIAEAVIAGKKGIEGESIKEVSEIKVKEEPKGEEEKEEEDNKVEG